jgi:pyrroloquinoline quinone (PQQ) biosynthesis protein C
MEHFKSPFEAGDLLSAQAQENRAFFDGMLERARAHRFYSHPFTSNPSNPANTALPRETVSFVLTSFYGIVSPFTGLLCSLGGQAPNLRSRFALMDNIYEEMGCGDLNAAHPRLYLRMLASIGVTEQAAESLPVLRSIRLINDHLREVVARRPFAVACAVLASAEATIPPSFPVLASMARGAFREIDMTFFDRHGVRDEGHSDDASMLFAISADRSDFAIVEEEVRLDLEYRSELFDEWMAVISGARTTRRSDRPSRPLSARPPAPKHQSVPPPA